MELNYQYFLVILQLILNLIQIRQKVHFIDLWESPLKKVKSEHLSSKLIVGCDFNATIGKDCTPDRWVCWKQSRFIPN